MIGCTVFFEHLEEGLEVALREFGRVRVVVDFARGDGSRFYDITESDDLDSFVYRDLKEDVRNFRCVGCRIVPMSENAWLSEGSEDE